MVMKIGQFMFGEGKEHVYSFLNSDHMPLSDMFGFFNDLSTNKDSCFKGELVPNSLLFSCNRGPGTDDEIMRLNRYIPNNINRIIDHFAFTGVDSLPTRINIKKDNNFSFFVEKYDIKKVFRRGSEFIEEDKDFLNSINIKTDSCIYLAHEIKDVFYLRDAVKKIIGSFIDGLKEANERGICFIRPEKIEQFRKGNIPLLRILRHVFHDKSIRYFSDGLYEDMKEDLIELIDKTANDITEEEEVSDLDFFSEFDIFSFFINFLSDTVHDSTNEHCYELREPFLVVNKDFFKRKQSKSLFKRVVDSLEDSYKVIYLSSEEIYLNNNQKVEPYYKIEEKFEDLVLDKAQAKEEEKQLRASSLFYDLL